MNRTSTPPQNHEQRTKALESAMRRKQELARFRRDLHAGRLTLTDVLTNPPAVVLGWSVFEVVLLAPGVGNGALSFLNEKAIRDQINLAMPLGATSPRVRRWVIEHQPGRGSRHSLARRRGVAA